MKGHEAVQKFKNGILLTQVPPTPREMSTQHPHLEVNEKEQTEELSCLKMADSRAESKVFRCFQPEGRRVVNGRAEQS